MNKSVKTSIVNKAIESKFKPQYEKAFRAVCVAARKLAVANSKHEEFKALKLPVDMLKFINYQTSLVLSNYIFECGFIQRTTRVSFDDPVYGYEGCDYLRDNDLPELAELRALIKTIESEHAKLSTVIHSYRNVKTLVADLPWVEQYLPVTPSMSTGLIAADVIADINATFGG